MGTYLLEKYGRSALDAEQAAAELGVEVSDIVAMVERGALSAIPLGGGIIRISVAAIDKLLGNNGGEEIHEQRTLQTIGENPEKRLETPLQSRYHAAYHIFLNGIYEDATEEDEAEMRTRTNRDNTRNTYGSGSVFWSEVYQEWRAQFGVIVSGQKKRKLLKGFSSEDEAREAMFRARLLADGEITIPDYREMSAVRGRALLADRIDKHLELNRDEWADGTYEKNFYHAEKLKKLFDGEYIDKINRTRVEEFRLQIAKKEGGGKYSAWYTKAVFNMLNAVMERAVDDGLIDKNPCRNIKKPDGAPTDSKAKRLNAEQVIQLKMAVKDNMHYRTLIDILFGTGMRIGELLGLLWQDVDFERMEIHIRKAMTKKRVGKGGSRYERGKTKTDGSVRTIPMLPAVAEALIIWRDYVKGNAKLCEGIKKNGTKAFVMVNTEGKAYNYQALQDKFGEYITSERRGERAIKDFHFTFNFMRHTFATDLNTSEVKMDVIQKLLGHAKLETTMGYYADTTDESVERHVAALPDSFNQARMPL
jgi:integrase